jgi:hypothetical protein
VVLVWYYYTARILTWGCVWGPTSRSKASDDGSQISPEYLDKETADAIAGIRG